MRFMKNRVISPLVTGALLAGVLLSSLAAPLTLSAQSPDFSLPSSGGLGLFVPTGEVPWLPVGVQEIITGLSTNALNLKSIQDEVVVSALKLVINSVREMVRLWIITGRFEMPVFSTSFSIDAAQIAENASRIFLSQLTGINFCSSFSAPPIPSISISKALSLSCTLPSRMDQNYSRYLLTQLYNPQQAANDFSLQEMLAASNVGSNKIYTFAEAERLRGQEVARALDARRTEYLAGQGFLGIRDEKTGKITTPGTYVAELVKQTGIVGPRETADVAQTVQQAVDAIIETAVRTVLEKGLSGIFSK